MYKLIFSSLIMFLFSYHSYSQQYEYFLYDEFIDNRNGWEITNNDDESAFIANRKYNIEIKSSDAWHWWLKELGVQNEETYIVDLSFERNLSGDNKSITGLHWGAQSAGNIFIFAISDLSKTFSVFGYQNTQPFVLVPWQKSQSINSFGNTNRLTVVASGEKFAFFINGIKVAETKRYSQFGYAYGIYANLEQRFSASKFFVAKPKSVAGTNPDNGSGIPSDWSSNGSCFAISKDGVFVTNYHVIENTKVINIELVENGIPQSYSAQILVVDKANDLALIKINDNRFKPFNEIPYALNTKVLDVGSECFTLGYPKALSTMGKEIKFTDGKISAKSGYEGSINNYQITVPVQPGNSGGPLFDNAGNIIGVIVAKHGDTDNVTYAVKGSYLLSLIESSSTNIQFSNTNKISQKPLTEKIKAVQSLVGLLKTK